MQSARHSDCALRHATMVASGVSFARHRPVRPIFAVVEVSYAPSQRTPSHAGERTMRKIQLAILTAAMASLLPASTNAQAKEDADDFMKDIIGGIMSIHNWNLFAGGG